MSNGAENVPGIRLQKLDGKIIEFDFINKTKSTFSPAAVVKGVNYPETFIGTEKITNTEATLLSMLGFSMVV